MGTGRRTAARAANPCHAPRPRERVRVKQRSHEAEGQKAEMSGMSSSMKQGPVPMAPGSRAHMKEGLCGGRAVDTYDQGPA